MGIYRSYSCPKCGKTLESFVPEGSRGVGEPFRQCPKCQAHVVVKELFNEWDLLTPAEQRGMRYRAVWTAVQLGGFGGIVVGMVSVYWFMETIGSRQSLVLGGLYVGALTLLGFSVHFHFVKRGLQDAILQSKERMRNPAYCAKLVALRLMK